MHIDAYLGDAATEVSEEQKDAMRAVSDRIASRYSKADDNGQSADAAFDAAVQVIAGWGHLDTFAAAWAKARRAERESMVRLTGAIIASSATMTESQIVASTGINRMTIRKALGKS
jgi:DNA-binding GntR family transcriptional regulator